MSLKEKLANTTLKNSLIEFKTLLEKKGVKVKPPLPGKNRPLKPRATRIKISRLPIISRVLPVSLIPLNIMNDTKAVMTRNVIHQGMLIPQLACAVCCNRNPKKAILIAAPMGSYRKYSQDVRNPPRGCTVRLR